MERFRHLIDRLQIWLYLMGETTLARLVGRWGSPPGSSGQQLPPPQPPARTWTTADYHPAEPLVVRDFDPTFKSNPDIDVAADVAIATSRLEVN